MDNIAVSREGLKKANKENAQPANGCKSFIKSTKASAAPFHLKSNKKEESLVRNGPKNAPPRSKAKLPDARSETEQRDGNLAADATVPKPPAPVPSSKSAPGMYKGKIIQSKIGAIWKSSATASGADPKPENQRAPPGRGTQKPAQARSRSLLVKSAQVSKPAVTGRRPGGTCSARPPTLTTTASSRSTNTALNKRNGAQSSKPKLPETDKQVSKPPVSGSISHYRLRMETEEEKRAKLAEWLASKGKTLKRPAMTTASAKPEADVKPKPRRATRCDAETEPRLDAQEAGLAAAAAAAAAAQCADTQRAQPTTHGQTPGIMTTSLDLQENSDAHLPVDPQDDVDDIVVNLCDALEAMAAPSQCNDLPRETDACNDVEVEESEPEDESSKDELKNETSGEQLKVEQVKEEVEEESDDDCVVETTPQMEGASLIMYNVKTTPYLQSVKKTIADDAGTNASRRKSNIRDLKYLTPVRRSCRIQGKSSVLPTMLHDHDPCVSSLAELVKLDDSNAYIYRKNPSLLEDVPDRGRE